MLIECHAWLFSQRRERQSFAQPRIVLYQGERGLPPRVTLYYNSKDSLSSSLGTGWSQSYDTSLKEKADGSVVLHEGNGNRKLIHSPAVPM